MDCTVSLEYHCHNVEDRSAMTERSSTDRSAADLDILLVEDNPGDVRLIEEAFADVPATVSFERVADGKDAMGVLRARRDDADAVLPDLMLLDLNLPRMDGFGVLDAIRNDPELALVPTLILTSSGASADVVESYERGANAYLTKPADLEEFTTLGETVERFWAEIAELPPPSV